MKPHFWAEILTRDNLLHVVLGIVLMAVFGAICLLPFPIREAVAASFVKYFREVTQFQVTSKWKRVYEQGLPAKMNFFEGWALNRHSNFEWIPSSSLLIAASVLWWWLA